MRSRHRAVRMAVSIMYHSLNIHRTEQSIYWHFSTIVTDSTTATGASPERIADDIRKAILSEEQDVVLAPLLPIAVQWLRLLCPSLYFWVMEKRARRMQAATK